MAHFLYKYMLAVTRKSDKVFELRKELQKFYTQKTTI